MSETTVDQAVLSVEALEALKQAPITEVRPYVARDVGKQRLIWMGGALLVVSMLLSPWTLQHIYGPLLGVIPEASFGPFVLAMTGNLLFMTFVGIGGVFIFSGLAKLRDEFSGQDAADQLLAQYRKFHAEAVAAVIAEAAVRFPQGIPVTEAPRITQTAHQCAYGDLDIDVFTQRGDANGTIHMSFMAVLLLGMLGVWVDEFVLHLLPTAGILMLLIVVTGMLVWRYGEARDARLFMMAQFDPQSKGAPAPFGPGTYLLILWASLAATVALYGPSRPETPVEATPRAAAEKFLTSLKADCAKTLPQSPNGVGCALLLAQPEGVVAIFEGRPAPEAAAVLAVSIEERVRGSDFRRLTKITLDKHPGTDLATDTYLVTRP